MNRLTAMLPPIGQEYREFIAIHEAIIPELDQLKQEQQEILDAQFIKTCPLKYIGLWEKDLGITDGEQYDLETRRINCLNKKNDRLPYNRKIVNDKIYSFVPKEYCSINWGKNYIYLKITYEYDSLISAMRAMLDEILPLNMIIELAKGRDVSCDKKIYSVVKSKQKINIKYTANRNLVNDKTIYQFIKVRRKEHIYG